MPQRRTRNKIKYPAIHKPLGNYGMYGTHGTTGYDALISILGQLESVLDALESPGTAHPGVSGAERARLRELIIDNANALTELLDSTLPDPSNTCTHTRPLREKGIYDAEAPIELFRYSNQVWTHVQEPLSQFLAEKETNASSPTGLAPFISALENILRDIRACIAPWLAEFSDAVAQHDAKQRSNEPDPPPNIGPDSGTKANRPAAHNCSLM